MKNSPFLFLLSVLLFVNCTDSDIVQTENVHFELSMANPSGDNGRMKIDNIPDGASLRITVQNSSGQTILNNALIPLLKFGERVVSEPIELRPGRYIITDFMIVEGESTVLFAVPKKDSPLSKAVAKSLPYSFHVSANNTTNPEVEVIDVAGHEPEKFGYASFGVRVVHPLSVSVFTEQNGKLKLSAADAYLYQQESLVEKFTLGAKVNLISFEGDKSVPYRIVIRKPGYPDFSQEFMYDELIASLAGIPLKVILQKENTDVFKIAPDKTHETALILYFSFEGEGSITLDLGNMVDTIHFTENDVPWYTVVQDYDPGRDTVYVRGDIDQITTFESGQAGITYVNTEVLPNLERISFHIRSSTARSMQKLDLSANDKLIYLGFISMNVGEVILPDSHHMNLFVIQAEEWDNDPVLEYILNNIYQNTVNKNIRQGQIDISFSKIVLSESAKALLTALEDQYDWEIHYPNPEYFE